MTTGVLLTVVLKRTEKVSGAAAAHVAKTETAHTHTITILSLPRDIFLLVDFPTVEDDPPQSMGSCRVYRKPSF